MMVLRKLLDIASSPRDEAIAWLLIGAIFFAMRSCEYLKTAATEAKRTMIVKVKHIIFKKGNRIMSHSDRNLEKADLVSILFEYQKNDRRDVRVHMFRSGNKVLCPVIAWAKTVKRVRKIPKCPEDAEVCLFSDKKRQTSLLQAAHVRSRLRAVVDLLGEETLGFKKEEIGLHSIRSGGAMAMFLSGTSVIVIQRVGRWSSEAFLEYIRDQVETFTLNVSKKMLKYEEFFNLSLEAKNNERQKEALVEEWNLTDRIEDGPASLPFCVKVNKLALTNEK